MKLIPGDTELSHELQLL